MLTAIIQARLGSTRLPYKVMADLGGRPMWEQVARRAARAAERVVIATPDPRLAAVVRHPYDVYVGGPLEVDDVLSRYYCAALAFDADPIIRITADCPLVDVGVLFQLVAEYSTGHYDYVSVATGSPGGQFPDSALKNEHTGYRYPDGLDAEIFSLSALRCAWANALERDEREHVTPFIWRNPRAFSVGHIYALRELGHLRWTVDTQADFDKARAIYAALGPNCALDDVVAWELAPRGGETR